MLLLNALNCCCLVALKLLILLMLVVVLLQLIWWVSVWFNNMLNLPPKSCFWDTFLVCDILEYLGTMVFLGFKVNYDADLVLKCFV